MNTRPYIWLIWILVLAYAPLALSAQSDLKAKITQVEVPADYIEQRQEAQRLNHQLMSTQSLIMSSTLTAETQNSSEAQFFDAYATYWTSGVKFNTSIGTEPDIETVLKARDEGYLEIAGELIEYYGIRSDKASIVSIYDTYLSGTYGRASTTERYYRLLNEQMKSEANKGKHMLITNGDSDSRRLLVHRAQSAASYILIEVEWLKNTGYMQSLAQREGFVLPAATLTVAQYVRAIQHSNPQLSVHLSPTLDRAILNELQGELLAHGLTFVINQPATGTDYLGDNIRSLEDWISLAGDDRVLMNAIPGLQRALSSLSAGKKKRVIALIEEILARNGRTDLLPQIIAR